MVRARWRSWLVLAIAGGLLANCATTEKFSAASDIRALLIAIRDDDRVAFEAHIDRRALQAQMQTMLVQGAKRSGAADSLTGVALALSGPLSKAAGKLLLRPEVFRAVAEYYGYAADTPIPDAFSLTLTLRALPDGRVCATRRRNGPCLLTFAHEGEAWRLVGFDGDAAMLRLRGG